MSKSVIVIDTPSSCRECRFCKHEYPYPYCRITINSMNDLNEIPEWCPLSPIPEKIKLKKYTDNTVYDTYSLLMSHYAKGWNEFREELLKGKE